MPRKPKPLYPIYSLVIAGHHMSGRPSYVTLKCEKHAITVLRYMFGSVYNNDVKGDQNGVNTAVGQVKTGCY